MRRGDEREGAADGEADEADAAGLHARIRPQRPPGADQALDLRRFHQPAVESGREGVQRSDAEPRQRVGEAHHARIVRPRRLRAEREHERRVRTRSRRQRQHAPAGGGGTALPPGDLVPLRLARHPGQGANREPQHAVGEERPRLEPGLGGGPRERRAPEERRQGHRGECAPRHAPAVHPARSARRASQERESHGADATRRGTGTGRPGRERRREGPANRALSE